MTIFSTIEEAVLQIANSAKTRETFTEQLNRLPESTFAKMSGYPEGFAKKKVTPMELNHTLVGVDSGFCSQEWFLLDLMLVRATAAIGTYEKNRLVKMDYEPASYHFPTPLLNAQSMEREEVGPSVSINRLMREWKLALDCIEKYHPYACLIDGSLLPQFMDKPSPKSQLRPLFDNLCRLVEMTYQTAEKNNCLLIGTVEDSRAKRWGEHVTAHSTLNVLYSDPIILSHWLPSGERTGSLTYASKANEHPILSEMNAAWQNRVHLFYLRPSNQDFPLRVEFLTPTSGEVGPRADEVASLVLRQTNLHPEYAYPAVLIEADLRSKLTPQEINIVQERIADRVQKSNGMFRRRDRRPFG